MGYYLAVGDLIISDGSDDASGYIVTGHPTFPEPEPDGYGGHLPAVREFAVWCTGSTASAAHYKAALLRRECVRDEYLYFRHGATGDVLSCRIRDARCVESEYMPGAREAFGVLLEVNLVTDPYWLGAWSAETSASADVTLPADHFDIADPGGEVDALLSVRCVPTTSGTLLALGVKPDPNASYTYRDDYSGSADANMVDGSGSAVLTASASYAAVGTAPDINTNDCRGRHLLLARADCSATSFATTYLKARTTTAGNLISTSVSVDETAVPFSASALKVYELGDVAVPAGAIPDVGAGSGWTTASAQVEKLNDSGTLTFTSSAFVNYEVKVRQSFAGFDGRVTHIEYYLDSPPSVTPAFAEVWLSDESGTVVLSNAVATYASGTNKVELDLPYRIQSGVTYSFGLKFLANASFTIGFANSSGDTDDILTVLSGSPSDVIASKDLLYTIYGQTTLGFNTTSPVLTAQAEASAGVQLDYVQRVPIDYGAIVYRDTGVMGLYYDADTDTPYDADSDGIGIALYDKCEIRKPLRVKPGVTNRVVVAIGQGDETPAGVSTLTYKTRPRYLTATG